MYTCIPWKYWVQGERGMKVFFENKKKMKNRKWKIGDREGWLVDWRLIKGDESCESWGTETQFFGINDRKRVCNMCVKAEKGGFLTPVLGVYGVYTVCVYYVSCISWKNWLVWASISVKSSNLCVKKRKKRDFHSCPGCLWCVYYVYMYTLKILGAGREGDESFFWNKLKIKQYWKY